MTLESGENKKIEQMPINEYEKLTDIEKDELWEQYLQESEHPTGPEHHLVEFKNINRNELSEKDWIVWDRVDKNDIVAEEEFNKIEEVEIKSADFNDSRSNLYAMLRNRIIRELIEERKSGISEK